MSIQNISPNSGESESSSDRLAGAELNPVDQLTQRVSSEMRFNPDFLTDDPPDNGGFYSIQEYLRAIEYDPESRIYLGKEWGYIELQNIDLDEPANPEEALAGFLKTAAALEVNIPYSKGEQLEEDMMGKSWEEIKNVVAPEEKVFENETVMTLEEMILDVYPGLEKGVEEIRAQLDLAINDPKKFRKQFEGYDKDLRRWLAKAAPYAAALITIGALASCTPMSNPNSESVETEKPSATMTLPSTETPTHTQTFTPTPTQTVTASQTASPTPTFTNTPIPTSEDFKERDYTLNVCFDGREVYAVFYSNLLEYMPTGDEPFVQVEMILYDGLVEKIDKVYIGEKFLYRRYDLASQRYVLEEEISNPEDLERYIVNWDHEFGLYLLVDGRTTLNRELFEDYINGYKDLDLKLAEIIEIDNSSKN